MLLVIISACATRCLTSRSRRDCIKSAYIYENCITEIASQYVLLHRPHAHTCEKNNL